MPDINLLPPDVKFKEAKPRDLPKSKPKFSKPSGSDNLSVSGKNFGKPTAAQPGLKPVTRPEIKPDTKEPFKKIQSLPSSTPIATTPKPALKAPWSKPAPAKPQATKLKPADPKPHLGLEVNFIESQLAPFYSAGFLNKLISGGIFVALEITLIIIGYFTFTQYYVGQKQAEMDKLNAGVAAVKKEVTDFNKDRQGAVVLQKKITAMKGLLGNHIYWSEFLKFLETQTLPEVYYTNASADGHKVILSAHAPDYLTVAKQIVVFSQAKDSLAQVGVRKLTRSADKTKRSDVTFDIDLTLTPKLLQQ